MPSRKMIPPKEDVEKILTIVRNANESLEEAHRHSQNIRLLSIEKSLEACISIIKRVIESLETSVSEMHPP